jgi:hypothetical protein
VLEGPAQEETLRSHAVRPPNETFRASPQGASKLLTSKWASCRSNRSPVVSASRHGPAYHRRSMLSAEATTGTRRVQPAGCTRYTATDRLRARDVNSCNEGSCSFLDLRFSRCWKSPPIAISGEREPSRSERTEETAPEKPNHAASSSLLSSSCSSRFSARSADEADESLSFASLPCLSSSRSDVRSFKVLLSNPFATVLQR